MMTVAYLGPEHTNAHVAAQTRFGRRALYLHAPTVEDVFQLVEREEAEWGVVPIENSLEGAVTHTLDRFLDFKASPVRIHGEIERPIRHALIMRPGAPLAGLSTVYSHPQALAQCHRWLAQHLPRIVRRETDSTADAVRYVLQEAGRGSRAADRAGTLRAGEEVPRAGTCAAIGRLELARAHRLRAIPIPEPRENKTRFLILGLGEPRRGRTSKTSILFALKDRPGALYDALTPFKRERINLTKIESRPSKRKAWEYFFFIDVEGHASELRMRRALAALQKSTSLLRVLGSYPINR